MTGWRVKENLNQARTRDLNEATEHASVALAAGAGRERFACECGDIGCTGVICLTRAEYETVRAYPTQFAIMRDHENPECEFVVYENDRWAIVQAVGKEAVMAARRSDPRAAGSLAGAKGETNAAAPACAAGNKEAETMATFHQNIAEWRGKMLVDRDGDKIGKLEDVYVDVETDEPMFGTVKEGRIGRHLTFVPLGGITIGPDSLQVRVPKEQVRDAPNIEPRGDELTQEDESVLYHHYQLNYIPPDTESGRRLARR